MLVQSFRTADNEWAIDESLNAACTLCDNQAGRSALLRHGMLRAVQQSMRDALHGHHCLTAETRIDHLCVPISRYILSEKALAMCANLLAAFAKCKYSRSSLAARPETALVMIDTLRWCWLLCLLIFTCHSPSPGHRLGPWMLSDLTMLPVVRSIATECQHTVIYFVLSRRRRSRRRRNMRC